MWAMRHGILALCWRCAAVSRAHPDARAVAVGHFEKEYSTGGPEGVWRTLVARALASLVREAARQAGEPAGVANRRGHILFVVLVRGHQRVAALVLRAIGAGRRRIAVWIRVHPLAHHQLDHVRRRLIVVRIGSGGIVVDHEREAGERALHVVRALAAARRAHRWHG